MSKCASPLSIHMALAMLLAVAGAASPAAAQDTRAQTRFANLVAAFAPRHLADGRATTAPSGFVRFCSAHVEECDYSGPMVATMTLDPARRSELERVNRTVNELIQPETDLDHFGETERWTYPEDGRGDCEDYVLEKRRRLVNAGWPASVLLITVVRDRDGDGHAVLTVITDKGDLILDNQEAEIHAWKDTGYRFVKRQSQADPSQWVSLGETRVPPVVGTGR
ncbi:transglutaminase-like cysteine peptidase [Xanthobacter sp. KR7-65]|uniref:transglutaminase-like cysteine peptidase n=1 Tax=Xanthobacter sp. KR7-65 TaxID=3156612 RepID=UPI0032B5B2C6